MSTTFDEAALLEAIRRLFAGDAPGVTLGVGDDAAILEPTTGETVVATDMLVEGVDFLRDRSRARDIGWKSIVVNVSDIAAMGASPRAAVVSLGLPMSIELPWVMGLLGGMRDAATEYGLSIVGGDLSKASEVVISVTILGAVAPGRAVTRSGARVGDRLVVTGSLGAAAGGLMVASAASADASHWLGTPWGRSLVESLERPVARLAEAGVLASHGVTAMIDLSDGLARDLHHLCVASAKGARVEGESVPVAEALQQFADERSLDAREIALQGGEDFELLATIGAEAVADVASALWESDRVLLTDIGEITEQDEGVMIVQAGVTSPLEDRGFDHFSS